MRCTLRGHEGIHEESGQTRKATPPAAQLAFVPQAHGCRQTPCSQLLALGLADMGAAMGHGDILQFLCDKGCIALLERFDQNSCLSRSVGQLRAVGAAAFVSFLHQPALLSCLWLLRHREGSDRQAPTATRPQSKNHYASPSLRSCVNFRRRHSVFVPATPSPGNL